MNSIALHHHQKVTNSYNEEELIDAWRKVIMQGNQAYNTGRIYSAERYYKIACHYTTEMSLEKINSSDVIASMVVSYQNLAELYFNQQKNDQALTQYQQVHKYLIQFYLQQPALLPMIQKAVRKLGTELLAIIKEHKIESSYSKQVIAMLTNSKKSQFH